MSGFSSWSFCASFLSGWAWIDKALRIARTCACRPAQGQRAFDAEARRWRARLEQEGEVVAKLADDLVAEELRVRLEVLLEVLASREERRRARRVGAHPELRAPVRRQRVSEGVGDDGGGMRSRVSALRHTAFRHRTRSWEGPEQSATPLSRPALSEVARGESGARSARGCARSRRAESDAALVEQAGVYLAELAPVVALGAAHLHGGVAEGGQRECCCSSAWRAASASRWPANERTSSKTVEDDMVSDPVALGAR